MHFEMDRIYLFLGKKENWLLSNGSITVEIDSKR
jgi:hypothetical protein